jgi:dipeptidase E
LHGIELVDNPSHVPDGYEADMLWEGLGVVPSIVAPHYRSNHPESAAIEQVVQYFIDHHLLFKALRDGEALEPVRDSISKE